MRVNPTSWFLRQQERKAAGKTNYFVMSRDLPEGGRVWDIRSGGRVIATNYVSKASAARQAAHMEEDQNGN